MHAALVKSYGVTIMLSGAMVAVPAFAQGGVIVELRDLKGSVMVLKGKDYLPGSAGMSLASGDRVLVLEKAQVKVVINTGSARCEVDLRENQALTIPNATDCKALVAAVQTVPGAGVPGGAPVAGGAATGTSLSSSAAGVSGPAAFAGMAALSTGLFIGDRQKASGD